MALQRVIGSIFVKDHLAVQSVGFRTHLPVGDPVVVAEAFDQWEADEIVLADITASRERRLPRADLLKRTMAAVRTPLTVGGGVKSVADVEWLLHQGADRVFINTALLHRVGLAKEASGVFGSQCIVAWIDVMRTDAGLQVYSHVDGKPTGIDLAEWIARLEDQGAGEIILHAVHLDGALSGFDLEMAEYSEKASVPLILSGGAGTPEHFVPAFQESSISGACAGNMFTHSETAISEAKDLLDREGFAVRPLAAIQLS